MDHLLSNFETDASGPRMLAFLREVKERTTLRPWEQVGNKHVRRNLRGEIVMKIASSSCMKRADRMASRDRFLADNGYKFE